MTPARSDNRPSSWLADATARDRRADARRRRPAVLVAVVAMTLPPAGWVTPAVAQGHTPATASAVAPYAPEEVGLASRNTHVRAPYGIGLYGSADPTFDGVYRQSVAILGLRAAGRPVPRTARVWLMRQQCANGSFTAYRADPSRPCPRVDLTSFTGPDTNSTAMAIMALRAMGRTREAQRAWTWLRSRQNRDGGFPFLPGLASDVNSTGLAAGAARAMGIAPSRVARGERTLVRFVAGLQVRCSGSATERGGFAFQRTPGVAPRANDYATAQAAALLRSTLPTRRARPASRTVPVERCRPGQAVGDTAGRSSVQLATGYLARRLAGTGRVPNAFGPGTDWNATAWAALAMADNRIGATTLARTVRQLRVNVTAYVRTPTGDRPAALGTLMLVAAATGTPASRFGATNLVARLDATLAR